MIAERRALLRSYRGAPPGTRAFVAARLLNAPLAPLRADAQALRGRVVSLGAGLGVLDRWLTLVNPHVEVDGVEIDAGRVARAGAAPRTRLLHGDALDPPVEGPYDAALVCDLLHHVPRAGHPRLAEALHRLVRPGGTVLLKDIALTPRAKHAFNALHDRVVAGERTHCREPEDAAALFAAHGFRITSTRRVEPLSPYPHYLVRLERLP